MKSYTNKIQTFLIECLTTLAGGYLEMDSKKVRQLMVMYFEKEDWPYENSISDVRVFEGNKEILIKVLTNLPGVLIGTKGILINGLYDYIQKEFNKPIHIRIEENQLWRNLY